MSRGNSFDRGTVNPYTSDNMNNYFSSVVLKNNHEDRDYHAKPIRRNNSHYRNHCADCCNVSADDSCCNYSNCQYSTDAGCRHLNHSRPIARHVHHQPRSISRPSLHHSHAPYFLDTTTNVSRYLPYRNLSTSNPYYGYNRPFTPYPTLSRTGSFYNPVNYRSSLGYY